jgi:hypothetical protein
MRLVVLLGVCRAEDNVVDQSNCHLTASQTQIFTFLRLFEGHHLDRTAKDGALCLVHHFDLLHRVRVCKTNVINLELCTLAWLEIVLLVLDTVAVVDRRPENIAAQPLTRIVLGLSFSQCLVQYNPYLASSLTKIDIAR